MPRDKAKEKKKRDKEIDILSDFFDTTKGKLDQLRLKSAIKSVYIRSSEVKMFRESMRLSSKRRLKDYVI